MKNSKYIRIAGCVLGTFIASLTANAQEKITTPASNERINFESLWLNNTNNAAGGMIDAPLKSGEVEVGYSKEQGNFKRVQVGDDNSAVSFHAEGGGIYKKLSGIYLFGSITYRRDRLVGARYNASLIDPLRGMPFILADSTSSKWINQSYRLNMKATTPKLFGFMYAGISVSYEAGEGAKQVDPRPLVKLGKIEIQPSLLFTLGEEHLIGINFDFYNRKEDGDAVNSNHLSTPHAWEIVAPGYFSQGENGPFGSINSLRNYEAQAMGGGLQYSFRKKKLSMLIAANYMYRVEDALCSYTKPKMAGTVKEAFWNAQLAVQYKLGEKTLSFNYKHSDNDMDGIEYLQTYDNTYEIQSWITDAKFICSNYSTIEDKIAVDYMINKGNSYSWKMGMDGSMLKNNYIYYLPETTQNIKTFDLNAYVTHNFDLGKSGELLCSLNAGYSTNLKDELNYNGYNLTDVCYTDFTVVDFKYLTSNYTKVGANVTYAYRGIANGKSSLYISGKFNYYNPSSDLFTNRSTWEVKVGLAF